MATYHGINRTMIHASSAANATQHLCHIPAKHGRATVVDQDNMHFFWAVLIPNTFWPVEESHILREFTAQR